MAPTELAPDEFSDKLLAYLRAALKDAGVDYRVPPVSLAGGYETAKVRFQLDGAPLELSDPLVLRVFSGNQSPQRAAWESAVQNSLADQRYPVPRVFLAEGNAGILGGPFVIMQFVPGETMLQAEPNRAPAMLGAAHAALHSLSPEPVIDSLRVRGIEERWFRYADRLARLSGKSRTHPWLAEATHWLLEHRPPEPAALSICHGDFHPLNILVEDGEVSAILDWSGFSVADPVMDVAFTSVLFAIAAREILPIDNVEAMLESYYAAYDDVLPLDGEHLDYYRTLRCVMALVEGAEGQEVWARPATVARLTEWIQQTAGIRVMPPG